MKGRVGKPKPGNCKIGSVPSDLDKHGKAAWAEITKNLKERKILDSSDRPLLTSYCRTYSMMIRAEEDVQKNGMTIESPGTGGTKITKSNPAVASFNSSMSQLRQFYVQFGMGPASRGKVSGGADEDDELNNLMG